MTDQWTTSYIKRGCIRLLRTSSSKLGPLCQSHCKTDNMKHFKTCLKACITNSQYPLVPPVPVQMSYNTHNNNFTIVSIKYDNQDNGTFMWWHDYKRAVQLQIANLVAQNCFDIIWLFSMWNLMTKHSIKHDQSAWNCNNPASLSLLFAWRDGQKQWLEVGNVPFWCCTWWQCWAKYYFENTIFILDIQNSILLWIFKITFWQYFILYFTNTCQKYLPSCKILLQNTFSKYFCSQLLLNCITFLDNFLLNFK